jgi:class 3 adenylate cyclase
VLALEETEWNSEAVTAAQVTSLQEFRDLFATEVLAPGHEVGIEHMTFFFSDLLQSTELYERDGDAAAYGRVRRHFDVLRHHIATNNGAVVKTIGDSVMAVFYAPSDAVLASLAIQRDAADAFAPGDGFHLRIGLHQGGAIAVNADNHLDYFGRSVNIAARIETASNGGDVVLSESVWSRAQVRRVIAESALTVEPFKARLKGIEQTIPLYRIVAAPRGETPEMLSERRRGERRQMLL